MDASGSSFRDERVVGGVVHVSGHIAAPGQIRQSGGLRYVLGDARGGNNARVESLAAMFADARISRPKSIRTFEQRFG